MTWNVIRWICEERAQHRGIALHRTATEAVGQRSVGNARPTRRGCVNKAAACPSALLRYGGVSVDD